MTTETHLRHGPLSADEQAADRRLVARRELPLGRADLPARQPAAARAAAARARQAAAARPLGHDAGAEPRLRAPEPRDPAARPERDLRHRARPRRPGARRERLPRGHLQRGLPAHRPRRGGAAAAVPPVLVPGRDPEPRRARDAGLDPRGRRARLLAAARLRRGVRQPGPARRCASSATARPRPARSRRAGTRTSSSTRSRDGAVLPILHLNGYKIANPTVLARIEREELRVAARGLRLRAALRRGRRTRTAMHQLMAATLDEVARRDRRDPARARARTATTGRPRWPMIVLRTPKGWTGPKVVDGLPAEGTFRSHQVPLAEVRTNPEHLAQLEAVDAQSYRPEELFDDAGALAARARRAGARGRAADERQPARQRRAAAARPRAARLPRLRRRRSGARRQTSSEATRVLGALLRDVIAGEPRPLPAVGARRDRLEPARRGVRGDRPRLGGASGSPTTTTSPPTAG